MHIFKYVIHYMTTTVIDIQQKMFIYQPRES